MAYFSQQPNERGMKEYLTAHGWPIGLQEAALRSLYNIPKRYFIVDDSGSMSTKDGHRLAGTRILSCTRWRELVDSMRFHVGLAHAAGAPSEFRLLNGAPPCLVGCHRSSSSGSGSGASSAGGDSRNSIVDSTCIGTGSEFGSGSTDVGDDDSLYGDDVVVGDEGYNQIMQALRRKPRGGTPLCRHIREIVAQIQEMEREIRAAKQTIVVVIATDGRSSDGDIVNELRPMEHLPVQIVVRLCTDDDSIVQYWNGIDTQLNAELDVLDDLFGEAAEVYEHNKWLTYGEPIHRLREFGIDVKEFDLLDESILTMEQVRTMCAAILGGDPESYPDPGLHPAAFLNKINGLNRQLGTVYSPMKKTMRPWIEDWLEILVYLCSK